MQEYDGVCTAFSTTFPVVLSGNFKKLLLISLYLIYKANDTNLLGRSNDEKFLFFVCFYFILEVIDFPLGVCYNLKI